MLEQFDHHQSSFRWQVAINAAEMFAIQRLEKDEHTTDVSLDLKQRLDRVVNGGSFVCRWFGDVPFAGKDDKVMLSPLDSITCRLRFLGHVRLEVLGGERYLIDGLGIEDAGIDGLGMEPSVKEV